MEYGSTKAAIEAAERKIDQLTRQRDELLEALEEISVETCEDWTRWKSREAITRIKGDQPK